MQTEKYTKMHGFSTESHGDTAGSAKYISETGNMAYGAVCSELAAKIYGLHVLDRNIQDQDGNTTRFFLTGPNTQFANKEKV